jgi:hypothetical protein
MQQKMIFFSILFLHVFYSAIISGQEANIVTGGNASGSGGSVSYSIGQIVYQTKQGTTGSVAQGVQQAYEISVVTGIMEAQGISLMAVVYPNPANEFITLKFENFVVKDLHFQLFDVNGNILESTKIISNETKIVLSRLAPQTFFLKVIDGNKLVKTFKIIKN